MALNALYYYYYLIYTKIIPDDEPHATVIFTLSVSEMMILNFLLEFYLIKVHCVSLSMWFSVGILIIISFFNIIYYGLSKRGKAIVKIKPQFFNSHILSVIITALIFIAAIICMIFGSIYIYDLSVGCKFVTKLPY